MKSSEPCSLISNFLNRIERIRHCVHVDIQFYIFFVWTPKTFFFRNHLISSYRFVLWGSDGKNRWAEVSSPPVCFYSKPAPHCTGESFRRVSLGTGWAFKRAFPAIVASEIPPTDGVLWKNGLPIVSAGNFYLLGGLTNDSIVVLLYRGRIVWSSTTCSIIYLFFPFCILFHSHSVALEFLVGMYFSLHCQSLSDKMAILPRNDSDVPQSRRRKYRVNASVGIYQTCQPCAECHV